MKLGLGLYRHQLDRDHYRFAKQCGCTHVVVHFVDYFRSSSSNKQDDPPMRTVRGQPRLVYQPQLYQKLLDLRPSPSNALEFCVGTLAEMTEGDVYEATETYSRQQKLAYVHLRNVRGKVPEYKETFIDEGDVDILRVLKILAGNGYRGVLIPDHAPQMTCNAPWHAGMAYALGYIRAALQHLGRV